MTRALLALFVAFAGLVTTLFASGLTAKNHAVAQDLHRRERHCQMLAADIESLLIRVRGRVEGDSQEANVQDEGTVSGSSSLGGSRTLRSDVSKLHGQDARGSVAP